MVTKDSMHPLLVSSIFLIAAFVLTALLPYTHVGSGFGAPHTLSSPQENALSSPLHGAYGPAHAAFSQTAHASLLSSLCAPGGGGANASVAWFLSALRLEGLSAEEVVGGGGAMGAGGRVVHSVLRAGGGAGGTSALLFASPLPVTAVDLASSCGGGGAAAVPPPPATPHGSLLLLSLARALAGAPWRAADIIFVFYYDGEAGAGVPPPCGDWGPSGLAGCYAGGGGARGRRASGALAAWARAHRFDAQAEAEGGAGAGAAWRRLALREWAAAVAAPLPHAPPRARAPALQPLRHAAGPVRAAVVLVLPAAAVAPLPTAWLALTQGANGEQADSDLFAALRRALGSVQLALAAGPPAPAPAAARTPLRALAAAAWALSWGPSGAHGELLAAGIPALTLAPGGGGGGGGGGGAHAPAALGAALEAAVRSLNGLDEALHAGARCYALLPRVGSDAPWAAPRVVPLPEYAVPIALFHAPALALLLLPRAPPSARALLRRGAAPWAAALAAAGAAYVALMHGGVGGALARAGAALLPRAALPPACAAGGDAPFLAWAWAVAGGEVALGAALACAARAARRRRRSALLARPPAPAPPPHPPPPPVAWALLVQALAFFPLLYYNAPLAWAEAAAAAVLLVGAAGVAAAAPLLRAAAPSAAATLPSLLWLLTSPLHGLLQLASGGGERLCALAGGLRAAADLHATYGAHHVPVLLLLLLPLHAALAAAL